MNRSQICQPRTATQKGETGDRALQSWGRGLEPASQNQGKEAEPSMKKEFEVKVLSSAKLCPPKYMLKS